MGRTRFRGRRRFKSCSRRRGRPSCWSGRRSTRYRSRSRRPPTTGRRSRCSTRGTPSPGEILQFTKTCDSRCTPSRASLSSGPTDAANPPCSGFSPTGFDRTKVRCRSIGSWSSGGTTSTSTSSCRSTTSIRDYPRVRICRRSLVSRTRTRVSS